MQLTITVNERQVTTAVESANMLSTNGDEVSAIYITYCCSHITEDGLGVGIHLFRTVCYVTTSKDSVTDDDTSIVELSPRSAICHVVFALQEVQLVCWHIFVRIVSVTTDGYALTGFYLSPRLYYYLTVLSPVAFAINIVVVVR